MPIDRATEVAVSPLSMTRRIASTLNSHGNFRRCSAMGRHSFRPPLKAIMVSTKLRLGQTLRGDFSRCANVYDIMDRLCLACGGKLSLRTSNQPGYLKPAVFSIFECTSCRLSVADPCCIDEAVYDLIYSSASVIPGYDRYAIYAKGVIGSGRGDPLTYLADQENIYWAVKNFIDGKTSWIGKRILEVGAGLGYLTYAIGMRGIDIIGLDISAEAIDAARARYGNKYRCADIGDLKREGALFDAIILTEVIEHVEDPLSLLSSLRSVLAPHGTILVTTPNKACAPRGAVWDTEPPPVHLWWFTKSSLRWMASNLGMEVVFTEFAPYHGPLRFANPTAMATAASTSRAVFAEHGRLINYKGERIRGAVHAIRRFYPIARLYARLNAIMAAMLPLKSRSREHPTICAAFTPYA